jgi:hypothetical protein
VPLPPPPAAGPAPVDTDVTAKPPAPPPLPKAGDDAPRRGRDWGDDDDDDYDEDDLDVRNRRRRPQAVNSMAMTSMILGIVSVSSCFVMICCCGLLGAGSIATITGILAVIFGAISRVPGSESQSLTGLICGGIGAVLGMIEAVAGFTVLAHFGFFQGF